MDLKTYISDPGRKKALAMHLGASEGYLWQVATGWRGKRAGAELAIAIERATEELGPESVPRESLRPDLWGPSEAEGVMAPMPEAHDMEHAA